jgi:hypothetical protein
VEITFVRHGDASQLKRMIWAASRKNLRRVQIMALLFALIGALLAAVGATLPAVIAVVLAMAYALLPWWLVAKQLRRVGPFFAEPAQFTITETDVTVETAAATQTFRWSGFIAVRESGGFWVCINRAKLPSVIIPQDCLRPEDLLALRTFLANRKIMPAEYRI